MASLQEKAGTPVFFEIWNKDSEFIPPLRSPEQNSRNYLQQYLFMVAASGYLPQLVLKEIAPLSREIQWIVSMTVTSLPTAGAPSNAIFIHIIVPYPFKADRCDWKMKSYSLDGALKSMRLSIQMIFSQKHHFPGCCFTCSILQEYTIHHTLTTPIRLR